MITNLKTENVLTPAQLVAALQQLPPDAAITFRCYYTAAHWLQIKYRARIAARLGAMRALPDTFSAELNLPEFADPDAALYALALRQRELTGLTLNWLGTYEHAAQSWLRFMEYAVPTSARPVLQTG